MAKKKKKETVQYRLCKIRELEINVPLLRNDLMENFQQENLDFGFTFDYTWDVGEEIFSVIVGVVYVYDRESQNVEFLKFAGQVDYKIASLARYIDVDHKEIKLPTQLLAILTGIAISTIRGMIATRTFGKFQGDFYIPILDPMQVVNDYLESGEEGREIASKVQ